MVAPNGDDARSDETLLAAMAGGDASASRSLAARLAPVAYRVAYRMLGDAVEAEDVAQEAMLRLWRMSPDWRSGNAKVSTWLYRVAGNLATDRLRRRPTVPIDAVSEPEDRGPNAEAGLMAADRARMLQTAILHLPERQRQAIVLRHLEELGNQEIARIMDLGIEAVESLLARGRRSLKEALASNREELGYGEA